MESGIQLAERIREVFLDGTWIANTNYSKALSNLNMEDACRNIAHLNSIAALTFHVNYYVAGVLKVLKGGPLEIRDQYSFDMPPITSEVDWDSLRSALLDNAGQLAEAITRLTKEQLEEVFVEEKYGSFKRNIEGIIEHSYYHLGQVSLLRKMIRTS